MAATRREFLKGAGATIAAGGVLVPSRSDAGAGATRGACRPGQDRRPRQPRRRDGAGRPGRSPGHGVVGRPRQPGRRHPRSPRPARGRGGNEPEGHGRALPEARPPGEGRRGRGRDLDRRLARPRLGRRGDGHAVARLGRHHPEGRRGDDTEPQVGVPEHGQRGRGDRGRHPHRQVLQGGQDDRRHQQRLLLRARLLGVLPGGPQAARHGGQAGARALPQARRDQLHLPYRRHPAGEARPPDVLLLVRRRDHLHEAGGGGRAPART